jgi:hypothetical protein
MNTGHWVWNGKKFNPKDYVGFVYEIVGKTDKLIYIGIKTFQKKITQKPLKGKKRKRRSVTESDWKTYISSSKELQKDIEKNKKDYEFKIVKLCKTKTELKCYEAYYQLDYYVKGKWHLLRNEYIGFRLRIRK